MYINKLLIKEFGKFNNKEIRLKPGINVVYGAENTGKTTIKDFISGMLYGIDKMKTPGSHGDDYAGRKPATGGYSGKAYVVTGGEPLENTGARTSEQNYHVNSGSKSYLLERNFLRTTKNAKLTEIETGKEILLKHDSSYKELLYNMDKSTFKDICCIENKREIPDLQLADETDTYVSNLIYSGNSTIDKEQAVKYLKNEKKQFDNRKMAVKIEEYRSKMAEYGDVDGELEQIRQDRHDELDAYNIEIARLKREARQLVNEKDAAIPDEDEDRERSRIFLEVEALEDEDETPKKKKITDNIAVIMLTGIMVVAVIMLTVHFLGFQKSIQQLFTICTIAFVAITIIDGMFRKGYFDGGETIPDEEEFNQVVYELGRATESRTVRIEIDREFQEAHDNKLEELKLKEQEAITKREEYYKLKSEHDELVEKYNILEEEKQAIDIAIENINTLSENTYKEMFPKFADNISDIVSTITEGIFTDIKIDEEKHIFVCKQGEYIPLAGLGRKDINNIYLSIRICIASILITEKMPIILDDIIPAETSTQLNNILTCLNHINTEQTIIFTSNQNMKTMLDELAVEYNYVSL
jgi:uncharacterized protein YhaN